MAYMIVIKYINLDDNANKIIFEMQPYIVIVYGAEICACTKMKM